MKGFTYRFIIYGVIAAYVFLDVKVIQGPIYGWVLEKRGKSVEELRAEGVAATVFKQPIYETQVEYRIEEHLYQRGKTPDQLSEDALAATYKKCLEELILEHMLRVKVYHNENRAMVAPAVADAEASRDKAQFSDGNELGDALTRQGYLPGELERRAEGYQQQLKYLDMRIDISAVDEKQIPDAEIPELRRIRHIFYTTWQQDPGMKVREIQQSLGPLRTGWATFEELSARLNTDPNAKKHDGEVGWISRHRLPKGLAEPVFSMSVGQQQLVQSKIGWHFIELLEVRPARAVPYPEPSRMVIMNNDQRKAGLDLYLRHLMHREKDQVTIITTRLPEGTILQGAGD